MTERRSSDEQLDRFLDSLRAADPPPELVRDTIDRIGVVGLRPTIWFRWRNLVTVGAGVLAIALIVAVLPILVPSSPLAARSPGATSSHSAAASTSATHSSRPTDPPPSSAPPLSTAPPLPADFDYVRFLADDVLILPELDSDEADADLTREGEFATVLARMEVRGVEWIRVQYGLGYAHHPVFNGWVPRTATVTRGDTIVRVDPVYEPASLACRSGLPTVTSVGGVLPAHALACHGSRTLTFSPVQVRDEGGEPHDLVTGDPGWLALKSGLVMYDYFGSSRGNAISVQVDPASGVVVPTDQWIEVQGRFDHLAASTCQRSSDYPHLDVANREEAILLCRERFVVSAIRVLPPAEQPPTPDPGPTPGPPATRTITFETHDVRAPISSRFGSSGVWTGAEVIVWGGIEGYEGSDQRRSDGAAYDPARDEWRPIADGPLTEREGHLAVWTGTEMLVWGGHRANYIEPPDGAAYNPLTDDWREIADGPIDWAVNSGSVWTGTEWVIVTTSSRGQTQIAAYDPGADSWRTLPAVDDSFDGGTAIAWTGEELVLSSLSGMYRLGRSAEVWDRPEPYGQGIYGSIAWTGEQVIGIAQHYRGVDAHPRYWGYLTAWDPSSDTWRELPPPPSSVDNASTVWTGERAYLSGAGLVFDPASGEWWNLGSQIPGVPRSGAVTLWAGDRLFVWGGGVMGHPPRTYPLGYVLIPEW